MQIERERELRERERRLKEEQEHIDRDRRVRDEQQRWIREEAARVARAKEEAARMQKEREDADRRDRERRQREEKEKRLEEEQRAKREQREREKEQKREREEMEKRMQGDSGGRLGKRPYQDNGTYDAKRQAFSNSSYMLQSTPSIFNRLDHKSGRSGPSHPVGGAGMGTPSSIAPTSSIISHVNPEIISAATQALENIRKSVPTGSATPATLQAHISQLATFAKSAGGRGAGMDFQGGGGMVHQQYPPNLMRQSMHMRGQGVEGERGGGMGMMNKSPHVGVGMSGGGVGKLPPEDQRYNRRLGGNRSGGRGGYRGPQGRQGY